MEHTAATQCQQCGATLTGSFCSMCGTPNADAPCRACGRTISAGAAFCGHCGANVRGDVATLVTHTPTIETSRRPPTWLAPTVLGVVALAAIGWAATRQATPTAASASVDTSAELPPDLSSLTPTEQFLRLADRIENSVQSGDTATVVRFFPMMEGAYEKLPDVERTVDARFHIALLRAQVGHFPAAVAQMDTILTSAAKHLFVDYLRALIADYQGDAAAGRVARLAFREHFAEEIAVNRPEYVMHRKLLDDFLATTPTP